MSLSKEFKGLLVDRFTAAELADFLQISTADFVEMFEDDIEVNYEDLTDFIGLRDGSENTFDTSEEGF